MNRYCITFRSITYAQRGESVLHRTGISCSVQRTPRWMEEQGCGYCVRLQEKDLAQSIEYLRRKQVPFRKVYRLIEGAEPEEITL